MPDWISKTYTDTHFGATPTTDAKLEIFRDRVMGWQIEIAEALEHVPHAGYGMLGVLFSYFEMIAQYNEGLSSRDHTLTYFTKGFRLVFSSTMLSDEEIKEVYIKVRCGMYHDGYTRIGVLLSGNFADAVAVANNKIQINPHTLLHVIKEHFTNYIITLKNMDNVSLRSNFETMFNAGLGV